MKVVNIKWDTNNDKEILKTLPIEMEIPEVLAKMYTVKPKLGIKNISDWITKTGGYNHLGFNIERNIRDFQKKYKREYIDNEKQTSTKILKKETPIANKFEKAYYEYQEIKNAFQAANKENNKVGIEKAKADYKAWAKNCKNEGAVFANIINQYNESRENGNDYLNIGSYMNETTKAYAKCLKENGITKFTLSSGWSGAIEKALGFQKEGFRMTGITEIKGKKDPWTGKQETLAALIFENLHKK